MCIILYQYIVRFTFIVFNYIFTYLCFYYTNQANRPKKIFNLSLKAVSQIRDTFSITPGLEFVFFSFSTRTMYTQWCGRRHPS